MNTIIGRLCAVVRDREVLFLHTEDLLRRASLPGSEDTVVGGGFATGLLEELQEYFQGKRRAFSYRPRIPEGEASFRVFSEVLRIPYGRVSTYGQVAEKVGLSPRAVGQILKRNPVLILIPCHRVVGSRSLGGYVLGPEIKKLLLSVEGAIINLKREA